LIIAAFGGVLALILLAAGLRLLCRLRASLPSPARQQPLQQLQFPVMVTFDRLGTPTIQARTRRDAFCALGYLTARDRLFQMDMLRRFVAGRLAEVLGRGALDTDMTQRSFGFRRVAQDVIARLSDDQRAALQAYVEGVNAFIQQMRVPPPEFLGLEYRPEPWSIADSILIMLYIFQELTGECESSKRMRSVMVKTLPPEVVAFLTPDQSEYDCVLIGGSASHRPATPIPSQALNLLCRYADKHRRLVGRIVQEPRGTPGSNGWVVGSSRTADGRAILANDIHLPLTVPNIWYRGTLQYDGLEVSGVILPGLPAVILGSNTHVAWGFTNITGDFLDLVELEIHPERPDEYNTLDGWKRLEVVTEEIRVKGELSVTIDIKTTIWGPVSRHALMGQPVAVRWIALDPQAINISLIDIDKATGIDEALRIMQCFRGPPLNVMLADDQGRIGWTYCGKLPAHSNADSFASITWSNAGTGAQGTILPQELPVLLDPPDGLLATANNRTVGTGYPHVIGYNFANPYRAHRIVQQLQNAHDLTEAVLFALQLDTAGAFYAFYYSLAIATCKTHATGDPLLTDAVAAINAWDGKAEPESVGFGLLLRFRELLAERVIGTYLTICKAADSNFVYNWNNLETPLRALLSAKIPETLPNVKTCLDWDTLIRETLRESTKQLRNEYRVQTLTGLTWGRMQRTAIQHSLSQSIPWARRMLDMPQDALPGALHCLRMAQPMFGASVRLVVSPGKRCDGILHMPGGQSGHPLSRHYRDQHSCWLKGQPLPFLPGPAVRTLVLIP